MKTIKRGILLTFLFFLIIHSQYPIYAEDPEHTCTQTATESATITNTPEPQTSGVPSFLPSDTPTPTNSRIASESAELISSPEATLSPSPTATPSATLPPTITASDIKTGDATSITKAEQEVNRNVVGTNNCFVFLNLYQNQDSPIDLSNMMPADCSKTNSATDEAEISLANNDSTAIQQNLTAQTKTGENIASGSGTIKTGDATTAAFISNIANTNIVGSNNLFGVINIFQPTNQDLILPYEFSFINAHGTATTVPISVLHNTNNADIQNNIQATATTGNNKGNAIRTGDGTVLIRVANTANTNIVQSGFYVLHINALAPWTGLLQNWNGPATTDGTTITAAANFPTQASDASASAEVKNNNKTAIENNLNLIANTGGNVANGNKSMVQTGNATVKAFISNIANTNIIGNNWIHLIVNIFDNFSGNIVVPRPDVATGMSATAARLHEVDVTVHFGNIGTYPAHDVQVISQLPDTAVVLDKTADTQFDGSRLYWNLGTLEKNQIGSRKFRIKLDQPGIYTITSRIATSTDEPNKNNNSSQLTITVPEPEVVQPTVHYIRHVITPARIMQPQNHYYPAIYQKQAVTMHKLQSYQLRSMPGQMQGASNVRKIRQVNAASVNSFLPLFLVYVISGILGIYKIFQQ